MRTPPKRAKDRRTPIALSTFVGLSLSLLGACGAPMRFHDAPATALPYTIPPLGVSTERPRIPIFNASGGLVVFSMGRGTSQIYVARRQGGGWTRPERASFSDVGANFEPYLLPDGRTLLFGSTRPPGREPGLPRTWRTVLQSDGTWTEPQLTITTDSDVGIWYGNGPSEEQLYFGAELPGSVGKSDLWMIDARADRAEPTRLPEPVNSPYDEWDPYVLPGNEGLLFASDRPGGAGGMDIYISRRAADGTWGPPRNLGPLINTERFEVATAISPDGEALFFVREPGELFWITTRMIEGLGDLPDR